MKFDPKRYCAKPLLDFAPYQPGTSARDLEEKLKSDNLIKLSSNENLLGPSPQAIKAVQQFSKQVHLYPDGSGQKLKAKLAHNHQVSVDQITLGNGSNELLEFAARCFLDSRKNAVFSKHSFAVYSLVTQLAGAQAHEAPAKPASDKMPYGHDVDAMLAMVDKSTALVYIANPNNPTGTWLSESEIREFLEALPKHVVVVIDQAYAEYATHRPDYPDTSRWLKEFPNLIVTQTFSKIFALAGLRIGYALSSIDIASLFNHLRQPFNTNALAQEVAIASLDDRTHIEKSNQINQLGLQYLTQECDRLGLTHLPSAANFLCIEIGEHARATYQELLQRGIIVRPIANYQLPLHLRITIGKEEDNLRFINELSDIIKVNNE